MRFKFLADENFNHRILKGVARRVQGFDVLIAQNIGLLSHTDPDILQWAADNGRLLLTHDSKTMRGFAFRRIADGLSMPGVIIVDDRAPIAVNIEHLSMLIECSAPEEYVDVVMILPIR